MFEGLPEGGVREVLNPASMVLAICGNQGNIKPLGLESDRQQATWHKGSGLNEWLRLRPGFSAGNEQPIKALGVCAVAVPHVILPNLGGARKGPSRVDQINDINVLLARNVQCLLECPLWQSIAVKSPASSLNPGHCWFGKELSAVTVNGVQH
jgi:hypothetical protein